MRLVDPVVSHEVSKTLLASASAETATCFRYATLNVIRVSYYQLFTSNGKINFALFCIGR